MASPFALCSLLTKKFAPIRRELAGNDDILRTLVDPCKDMVLALNQILDWFSMVRRLSFPVADAPELQKRFSIMKIELQLIFPKKSGQQEDIPWGVQKVHGTAHTSSDILSFATTPFTDANVFEAGHRPNAKDLQHSTNRKDQLMCISKYHVMSTSLLTLNQAVSRRNKHLARRNKGDDASSSGSDDASNDELAFDDKGTRLRELQSSCPFWTCRSTYLHFTSSSRLSERVERGYSGRSLLLANRGLPSVAWPSALSTMLRHSARQAQALRI